MVRTLLIAWSLWLVPLGASAADAIWFNGDPGQTLYVRVRTSPTTSVAAALAAGTGNGAGFYYVTDATLVTAGLSSAATYPYKIFVGSPSTSNDDLLVGTGMLAWSGSAALPPSSNVTQISGDATAADNAESFFDGTGYGPLILRSTVANVNDQANPNAINLLITAQSVSDNVYNGCQVIVRDATAPSNPGVLIHGIVTASSDLSFVFNATGTPAFTIAAGDIVEILPPGFAFDDRALIDTEVAAIKTKTDFLPSAAAGTVGGLPTVNNNNHVLANVIQWSGTNVATPSVAGVPEIDITHYAGRLLADLLPNYSLMPVTVGAGPQLLQSTSIGTVNSQTSFTLTSGSADNDAYNNQLVVLINDSDTNQMSVRRITDYVGATKTVTIDSAPVFTIATDDMVRVVVDQ